MIKLIILLALGKKIGPRSLIMKMIKSYILFYLVIFPIISFTQSSNEPISNPKNDNNQTREFYLPDSGLSGYILSIEDLSNCKKKDDQW